jgi:Tol biopolymer transport system component
MLWILPLAALAADDDAKWDVNAPHGPNHTVSLDLTEGTWMSVTVGADRVVFDLLGDLWSVPLSGGEATRLTSGPAWDTEPQLSPDGQRIAFTSDRGGNENVWVMNADGTDPRPVTKEEVARCTDPVWDPAGPWLLVRRRTVDTRSIGVTELWDVSLDGGDGFALTKLAEHPHAGEAAARGRYVYFSSRHGRFEYDQSAVSGLWDIQRLDRRTGDIRPILTGPGSASRPTLSKDGRWMYFVSREREKTLLEKLDLETGERSTITDFLSPDELEAFALHGTYPRIGVAPDGRIVLWAQGKLWKVDPSTGAHAPIPFHVKGDWTLTDVSRWPNPIPDDVQARVLRWPTLSSRGSWAFSALGALWVRTPDGHLTRISPGTGYAPAWSPDGRQLAWTSWSDEDGGRLHVTGPNGDTETLPIEGQLTNPAWSDDGRELVVLRGVGGHLERDDLADEAWYDIVRLTRDGGRWVASTVRSIDGQEGARKSKLELHDGRVWYFEYRHEEDRKPPIAVLRSVALDGTDPVDHLKLGEAEEVAISPDFTKVAYKLHHQLWVTDLAPYARDVDVEHLPKTQITKVVGDWLAFSPDSREVTWAEGPALDRLSLEGLVLQPADDDHPDKAPDYFAENPKIVATPVDLEVPRDRPTGAIVLTNARVIPMTGEGAVLEGVNVVIERDRVTEIGPGATRPGAKKVDCTGKTIIPGLVDVHAHLHFSAGDILPEQEWRYQTALDFGVTTVHDPSANTDLVYTQAERVDAGYEVGPRVFSTGAVLYGALANDAADTPTLDAARAHVRRLKLLGAESVKVYQQSQRVRRQWYAQVCREEHVLCVPEGGGDLWMDLSMVVDGYQSVEHALPDTPLYADVIGLFAGSTQGGDGLGTFHTPTLQVAYGGLSGKLWFEQEMNPVDDPRLRRHTPTRWLEAGLWRTPLTAQEPDWRFRSTARDDAALQKAGVHVTLGAHGELQGLGVHWELWAMAGLAGPTADPRGMGAYGALKAATIEGARYLGLDHDLGTVEVGKLADLVVLNGNPLEDLHHTTDIELVVKNGEIFR